MQIKTSNLKVGGTNPGSGRAGGSKSKSSLKKIAIKALEAVI
jgi:hypothetical protein